MDNCKIPKIWCGNSPKVPDGYTRRGNSYDCMKLGFGSGTYSERLNHLPKDSLQRISYIGEKYEARFKKFGIETISKLLKEIKKYSSMGKGQFLKKILKNKNGNIDYRAYNSTVLFLYKKGVKELPNCKKLSM